MKACPYARLFLLLFLPCLLPGSQPAGSGNSPRETWIADNGDGSFTNPLFYDEFSDPDLIRVGDDFYLTGTTMHAMPGLPILHSRDLVNWRFLTYACERLDFGPEYRLQEGEVYGQGIWAPSFRYHQGTFYIFTNVNKRKTQVFRATNPAGPWTHSEMKCSLHDLSVLFDDDGRIFVIWGYDEIWIAELEADLSDIKPDTKRVLIPKGSGLGEGSHFYKIQGKYYILNTQYDPMGYMVCARAQRPEGPYEVTVVSASESFGLDVGWRYWAAGRRNAKLELDKPQPGQIGATALHQGGIVDTPSGEWWGFSMMDHNSVGRITCLSPVTWKDGWPYFGIEGNLTRTPVTWKKPSLLVAAASAPYNRSDDFSEPRLQPVWQWNHVPDDTRWSLTEKPGVLRLHSLPAKDFFVARNSLTQRAIGPESEATALLDGKGLKPGDVAGLALLNVPHAWLGLARNDKELRVEFYDQLSGTSSSELLDGERLFLRVHCDFDRDQARFSFSTDGKTFRNIGPEIPMPYQLKTFQGVRYALFNYNRTGVAGGFADFDDFRVREAQAGFETRTIPLGKLVRFRTRVDGMKLVAYNGRLRVVPESVKLAGKVYDRFRVLDRGQGRVALQSEDGRFVTVSGFGVQGDVRSSPEEAGDASSFQWQHLLRGDIMLLSLRTGRYLRSPGRADELVSADAPGAAPDRKEGACFRWSLAEP